MSFGVPELNAAVLQFLADNFPGRTPKRFLIVTHQDDEPISLPVCASVPSRPSAGDVDERGAGVSQCALDILETLRKAGRPLTTTLLLEEMGKRGLEWSQRSVSAYLARFIQEGTLENPEGARPRGYRFPAAE